MSSSAALFLLTNKSLAVTFRSGSVRALLVSSILGVLGGFYAAWLLTHSQYRTILSSRPYKQIAFDFGCYHKLDLTNTSHFLCDPLTANTESLINTITTLTEKTNEDAPQQLLAHLTSLMMNGFPLLSLNDFVRLSEAANLFLGSKIRQQIMSSPFLRDEFSNILAIRDKRIVLTPRSNLTESFRRHLIRQLSLENQLNITVQDIDSVSETDESLWAMVVLEDAPSSYGNGYNGSFVWDGESPLPFFPGPHTRPALSIRMPPNSIPDTRNYDWSPLKRNLARAQSGELLYFLSGFLSLHYEAH
eukprot:gene31569-38152_t